MSTRAHVIITDSYASQAGEGILFYRHSDGYPSGVEASLEKFLGMVKSKVGTYEHDDVEYVYVVNVSTKKIHGFHANDRWSLATYVKLQDKGLSLKEMIR